MSHRIGSRHSIEQLTAYLFDGDRDSAMGAEVAGWLTSLPRFRTFTEQHRDKIRKKVRAARDDEALLDLRAELRVARLLLADRGIELGFEAYGSQRGGPDFTLTHRATHRLNLEVTRLRRRADVAGAAASILAKLRQLPPSVPNALLLSVGDVRAGDVIAGDVDVAAAAKLLRAHADAKDEAFFVDRGMGGTRPFYERFLRLGAVYVLSDPQPAATDDPAPATVWVNASARIPIPRTSAQAVLRALAADQ